MLFLYSLFLYLSQIGCSKEGVVNGIQITVYCNTGWKMSLLDNATPLLIGHIDNGMNINFISERIMVLASDGYDYYTLQESIHYISKS